MRVDYAQLDEADGDLIVLRRQWVKGSFYWIQVLTNGSMVNGELAAFQNYWTSRKINGQLSVLNWHGRSR